MNRSYAPQVIIEEGEADQMEAQEQPLIRTVIGTHTMAVSTQQIGGTTIHVEAELIRNFNSDE